MKEMWYNELIDKSEFWEVMILKQKSLKTRWQKVNDIVLILHIVFPVWLIALMYTSSISGILFLIALAASLSLGVIYKLVQKFNRGRGFLYSARAIAGCAILAFYLPILFMMNFSHTKLMYSVKRNIYIYGVFGTNADYYERLLPSTLPTVCEDYSFRTQGSVPAQDYHPSSYLMFHTDTATLDSYTTYLDTLDCECREIQSDAFDLQKNVEWFCGQMQLPQSSQNNWEHAKLYWFDSNHPKAILLNYETGLVAILT